jgi:ferredoxin-NADP reductase
VEGGAVLERLTPVAQRAPGGWQIGTVTQVRPETPTVKTIRIALPMWMAHLPGQHYEVRLTAPDGYTAQRSYSIASDPDDPLVELMVECLPGGEVSGFLHDEVRVNDVLELRGPIGGWFTWTGDVTALAIGGGTGVVPLVAMLRHANRLGVADRLRLVAVGRTAMDLPYAGELDAAGALVALTRENHGPRVAAPPYPSEVAPLVADVERAYICGSVGFASYAGRLLGEVGIPAELVRVEQFGPTA